MRIFKNKHPRDYWMYMCVCEDDNRKTYVSRDMAQKIIIACDPSSTERNRFYDELSPTDSEYKLIKMALI